LFIYIESNKETIASLANARQEENITFRSFLKKRDAASIDNLVFKINEIVEDKIDCTDCGACCNGLMINVTEPESERVAEHLLMSKNDFKEKYIEESLGGQLIINTIPCHFLNEKKCTIYENRFKECREFPHLNRPHFTDRLFGTLIHYSICPIIYNVVEQLKIETNFIENKK